MEPIDPTIDAIRELTRSGDETIARTLWRITREVERIVPEIVGLSVTVQGNLTFTMTTTNLPAAVLDGVQYLDGGPCEDAVRTGKLHSYRDSDPVDENRWEWFARATAAAGVGSTLSLPILENGVVVAGINLYASTPSAFDDHHEELASACSAEVDDAITNADMSFSTRFQAAKTPERLRAVNAINQAVGVLVARWQISTCEAEQKLQDAAQRAGITDADMAHAILHLVTQNPSEDSQ